MAKLTYWIAECVHDNACYSIIGKTKRNVQLARDEYHRTSGGATLLSVAKRTIVYDDAFSLFEMVTAEGGGRGYSNA